MVAGPIHGSVDVPILRTVLNATSVIGSIVGTRACLAAVSDRSHRDGSDVEVSRGQVKARIVFDLDAGR